MRPPERPGRRGPRARGGRDEEPVRLGDSLAALSARLGAGSAPTVAVIFGRWEAIVGSGVASHVRPLRLVGSTLVVGADHPAWVTQVRHLAPEILEQLKEACAEGDVPERIEVRVLR